MRDISIVGCPFIYADPIYHRVWNQERTVYLRAKELVVSKGKRG